MSQSIKDLLKGNKRWVKDTLKETPDFFAQLNVQSNKPNFLWIGCADSRVPATEITGAMPGSIFVQRNIANMVVHTDSNLLSVVNYAVKELKVKHIIVCGHYGCGGVKAAMSKEPHGFLDNWLLHIKDVYRIHKKELDLIEDEELRYDRFVELNVKEQVNNLSMVSFIQEEWEDGDFPQIHGWVYRVGDGILKDLAVSVNASTHLDDVYQYQAKNTKK